MSFENHKSEVLNEILEAGRSLNNNGFINTLKHLKEAENLLKKLQKDFNLQH